MRDAGSSRDEGEGGRAAPPRDTALCSFLREEQTRTPSIPLLEAGVAERVGGAWQMRWGTSGAGIEQHFFDLASVTKPHFAVLVARLVERGSLNWGTLLHEILPEVSGTHGGQQTIEALLSHRSGLVAHIELFRDSWQGAPLDLRSCLARAACAKAAGAPGVAPVYSDLGYILVGFAVTRLLQCPLDEAFRRVLLAPWNLDAGSARDLRKRSPQDFLRLVAPTEIQAARGGLLRGQVHDDNAWALAGHGLCGHAGLFGNVCDVLSFGAHVIDACASRSKEEAQRMIAPLIRRRPGGSLRMGFDGVSGENSMAGKRASPETFGHLGFTGTSFWCDPSRERVTVLLTNRVYPTRDNPSIRVVRPKIHDFLWIC